jgi:phosphoserine phosphatase RsbU/P
MRSRKSIIRLSLFGGIAGWLALLITDLLVLFSNTYNITSGIPDEVRFLLLDVFIISLFFYYNNTTGAAERINFIDLLWRVFVMGLLTAIVFLVVNTFQLLLQGSRLEHDIYLNTIFYHIHMGLVIGFLITTFVVWKQLILYQKSKRLINAWQLFEYALLISIFFNFFPDRKVDLSSFILPLVILLVLGIILAANLKWVAYLDYKQKWKSIFLVLAIAVFIGYSLYKLFEYHTGQTPFFSIFENVFVLALFGFALNYSIFSLLVLIFNLPTSSVFEQKLEELINFQRLSQSTQAGYKVEQIYEILLESTVRAVLADAAWVEINNDAQNGDLLLTQSISKKEVENIHQYFKENNTLADGPIPGIGAAILMDRNRYDTKRVNTLQVPGYKSVLWMPLVVKNVPVGTLVVLKEVADGFNKEMVSIVGTFASQASISIENLQLMEETLENERYREELKIANRVQRSLLPKKPIFNEAFDLTAFSEAADQVGGDYYDMYQVNTHKFIVIIGDVSGKGTSAAFNMSQMKGVFHSLAELDLSPDEFIRHANSALSRCLEKTSFITATVLVIDTDKKAISIVRAGHCPTLYYSKKANEGQFIEGKGLGLGIIRNDNFNKHIQVSTLHYHSEDILLLYTDGITEATNNLNEEFGYERLKCFLTKHAGKRPQNLQQQLIDELFAFCDNKSLDDDYTTLIIKFK